MSGVPRSQRLLSHSWSAAGNSAAFICPDNTVTLVKSAYASNNGAAAAVVQLLVHCADTGALVYGIWESVPASGSAAWNGWFVLNPGDYMYMFGGSAGVSAIISGAVLQGAPLYPPAT